MIDLKKAKISFRRAKAAAVVLLAASMLASCVSSEKGKYFGKTVPPKDNVLRYISGSEPETLDPQLPDGQPEARIFMALYEGLVEYGPKDQQPIPSIAKSWEISPNVDEFVFHLRDNAKWSDGTPITARDFVYSLHRGFAPETISRTAGLGYAIKYSAEYNGEKVFAKKGDKFVTVADVEGTPAKPVDIFGPETEFNKVMRSPDRVTLEGDEKKRAKELDADPKLKAAVAGAEFVPIKAEDIGVEAIDDYTLRITLRQSAPYFLGLLAHQFFRLVPRQAIEKHGKEWTRPANIVTNGAFRIKEYKPYDQLVVERDPNYWDAANVHLDRIEFYPVEELSTIMNLYKAGSIDAELNHSIPTSWIDEVRPFKDEYLNFPEASTAYYSMNMTKPPFDNVKVRRAFMLGLDREALSSYRKITKPLYDKTPSGIYPAYDKAMERVGESTRKERGLTAEAWAKRNAFDGEAARKLLTEAGFPVQKNGDSYSCPTFPTDKVWINFNTNENNRSVAEYVQAQWKQNLGVTVPLKTMEFKTFLPFFKSLQYDGFSQFLWSGDYMDPYTFLSLHYGKDNEGGTGFYDPKYDKMLDEANAELDPDKRYDMLARAEIYLMDQVPVVPLTINATNWVKKPYIKGMYPNPGTLIAWKFVYIERDESKWDRDVDNIMMTLDPQVEKQLADLTATQKTSAK
ncbi:MAG: peptide ABC transporter substrate-binding protein [Pyrinomonadaceae bacterium]|nr:peptide ABC transporter substrate-binding protein [Pyrinomonadaceae bacterium]MBP6213318.1 peptide ABC transporter substrate-binding protein [Pyrinomonadaceae bacterium]